MPNTIQFIPNKKGASATLLDAVTVTQVSNSASLSTGKCTYQATVSETGSVGATIDIEFSNDGIGWLPGATITLAGTTIATDGSFNESAWLSVRANLTAISGTNAAVTVTVAES